MKVILVLISLFSFSWNSYSYLECDLGHSGLEESRVGSVSKTGCSKKADEDHHDEHEESGCSDCAHLCSSHTLIINKLTQVMKSRELVGSFHIGWMNRYLSPIILSKNRPPIFA